ncbi:Mg chelatase-like protein [Brachybacterium endophyticum]|uniref:Mg chelatase-like protein n=1 Tax=Brachybacterium endophyticum TaxID=2182385 RepID=A0A2U2RLQ3_9MICO|nr:YifB family Mg chelatase-like AAA ATPase [Brachybacterium endophyticum]PWH06725.1 Mg chelatase-like protein [Brachybacterium endophyticum]
MTSGPRCGQARTRSVALRGITGTVVEVEADVATGLPAFFLVGLPDSTTLQARERVRAAAGAVGAAIAPRRITVNLSPAFVPKAGSGFDLGIAVAILAAQGAVPAGAVEKVAHLGELGLDGSLRPVPGVLPALLAARDAGVRRVVVPEANAREAALVEGLEITPARDLATVLAGHGCALPPLPGRAMLQERPVAPPAPPVTDAVPVPDFADVIGQAQARRAAEVAAAGGHHLLLQGPPGTGKTMIASRIPGILPPLADEDALALSAVRSLDGSLDAERGLIRTAPFESPHHTASVPSIVGGGSGTARPGAVSRAHAGVLFLDEAPEFSGRVLEALREPLETGDITLHRSQGAARYPARFQLVLAANPCPCGMAFGNGRECTCTPLQRRRYLRKISGPVLDRMDMRLQVGSDESVRTGSAAGSLGGEPSARIAQRVVRARRAQAARFADEPWLLNSQIPGAQLRREYAAHTLAATMLQRALAHGRLTLRGHDRVLRVAWTVADLEGDARPDVDHVGLALTLRGDDLR